MIQIEIPGNDTFRLSNLVLDYNGTLAVGGILVERVADRLAKLAGRLNIYVVTADTFGQAAQNLKGIPCELKILGPGQQALAKAELVRELGSSYTAAIGNGLNDSLMVKEAALGIAVILDEGTAVKTLNNADIVCKQIDDALELLLQPNRLVATLRT